MTGEEVTSSLAAKKFQIIISSETYDQERHVNLSIWGTLQAHVERGDFKDIFESVGILEELSDGLMKQVTYLLGMREDRSRAVQYITSSAWRACWSVMSCNVST